MTLRNRALLPCRFVPFPSFTDQEPLQRKLGLSQAFFGGKRRLRISLDNVGKNKTTIAADYLTGNTEIIMDNVHDGIIEEFKATIQEHEEQLFGLTLYLKGIELLYAHQPDIVEHNRQNFLSIKERHEKAVTQAKLLLQKAIKDRSKTDDLRRFQFPPMRGVPIFDTMTERASILVKTYERLFPGRPKTTELTQVEHYRLMEEASNEL